MLACTEYQQQDRHVVCGLCSAVMLVGTKNGNISVGEVEKDHKDEVHSFFLLAAQTFAMQACTSQSANSSALFIKSIQVCIIIVFHWANQVYASPSCS